MSNVVEHSVEIDAPVSKVFAYVDDFTHTKDWMYGLSRIDPVTDQAHRRRRPVRRDDEGRGAAQGAHRVHRLGAGPADRA
ncbi:hypothetical protein G5V59_11775 [Nocardioides sp. W3-2-3]|uniref:SRPBCC family protein n=1 Tax=Nocardioides convexus TaxID=2712224 RepID=UPI00241835B7|nr:SRPBCC family protein [Nocardioides convexus]NHA00481.1 hypothetical protein [Nocardioides convexus]